MTPTSKDILDYLKDRVERDLAPFADPGTELRIASTGRVLSAAWSMRAQPREAMFTLSDTEGIQVTFLGRKLSYKSFLSAPEIADLRGLAKMMLQAQGAASPYIETRALRRVRGGGEGPATEMMKEILGQPTDAATRVLFVTADAGAGKTASLKQLVRLQALEYDRGRTDCLLLYINAQGRALARFHEALATELSDLRSTIPYHAVAGLVRAGILIPVIDGFDELLGVGGYDDAFSSLSAFIEELDGNGQVVASARSAYYEDEFVARATSASMLGSQAWEVEAVTVKPWGEAERDAYVTQFVPVGQREDVLRSLHRVAARNEALMRKPFFVAKTVDLLLTGGKVEDDGDLLAQLVREYVERERTQKLRSRSGAPLLTTEQALRLLSGVAEDMWRLEARELDRKSVRETAAAVAEVEGLPEAVRGVVAERMPYFALLTGGDSKGRVAFEHEMFFGYFLASVLGDALGGSEAVLTSLLGRGTLPGEVAERIAGGVNEASVVPVLAKLSSAASAEGPRWQRTRENAGEIAREVLVRFAASVPKGVKLANLIFAGGSFGEVKVAGAVLKNVTFQRVDLTRAAFDDCEASDVFLTEVLVEPNKTLLRMKGLDPDVNIVGLRVRDGEDVESVFDPRRAREVLSRCGIPVATPDEQVLRSVDPAVIRILDHLARAYGRANPVCAEDPKLRDVLTGRLWDGVRKALIAHGIVTTETRSTGGPKKEFLRRQYLPDQLMAGASRVAQVPDAVRAFWDEMERECPA